MELETYKDRMKSVGLHYTVKTLTLLLWEAVSPNRQVDRLLLQQFCMAVTKQSGWISIGLYANASRCCQSRQKLLRWHSAIRYGHGGQHWYGKDEIM